MFYNTIEFLKLNVTKHFKFHRRVFLDGLIRTGTGSGIETSVELLKKKELSQLETVLVLLALGNARHASNDALKSAAVSISEEPNNNPKQTKIITKALLNR